MSGAETVVGFIVLTLLVLLILTGGVLMAVRSYEDHGHHHHSH